MNIPEIIRSMGLRMRRARQLKNDRQQDLAARMGVSRLTVMKMEKGGTEAARVPLETWLKAAEYLGLLATWEEVMDSKPDPFEVYDQKIRQEEKIKKGRVRKTRPRNT